MRGFHTSSFDPQTLVVLETAFDEAWLTLKAIGNSTVRPDELARSMLRLAMEGERDPVRLHDGALKGLLPATSWREANKAATSASAKTRLGTRNQHGDAGEHGRRQRTDQCGLDEGN